MDPKQIHDDIPADRAWQVGRRIYVRCGYSSNLNKELLKLGSKWDSDVKARWVGSGKRAVVIPLIQAHQARIDHITAVKAAGHWVKLPRGADAIYKRVTELDAVWDADRGQWAMPTVEALAEVAQLINDHKAAVAAARAETARQEAVVAEQMRQENAAAAVTAAQVRERMLIDKSGRVVSDERGTVRCLRLYGRMPRAAAERAKPQPGEVRRLSDGRRGLVLASTVTFWSQDMIDDGLVPGSTGDDPGWRCDYQYIVVAPTDAEVAADQREQAQHEDQQTIEKLLHDVDAVRGFTDSAQRTALTGQSIRHITESGSGGMITVTGDGAVWYQHPGFYDDWRHREFEITDLALLARIRAVLDGGPRAYQTSPYGLHNTWTVTTGEGETP